MIYLEDIKTYVIAIVIVIVLIFFSIFFYKWQTRAQTDRYCGSFNNFYCKEGVCDYKKTYGDVVSGYCRNKFLSF